MTEPADNDSRHWAQMSEAGAQSGLAFLFFCYRLGGKSLFKIIVLPVILYFFLVRGVNRRASIAYLKRVNRHLEVPLKPLLWQSFRHFWSFAMAVIDKFEVWHARIRHQDIVIENGDIIHDLRSRGRGAVVMISHLGNFEICRCLSTHHPDLKLTVLMHTKHAETFNRFFKRKVEDCAIDVLQVTEITPATAMLLAERVQRGELVAIAADRIAVNHPENGYEVSFLGEPALLPKGAFALAAILRAPVLTVFCNKLPRGSVGQYRVRFDYLKQDDAYPRRLREQLLLDMAREFARRLEQHCLAFPLQWFNFYDFWARPAGARAQTRLGANAQANTSPDLERTL